MRLIYEGTDITSAVRIMRADIIDTAGGMADSVELKFADPDGLWSRWKPEKGHGITILEGGFSSGIMYVDAIAQNRGSMCIKGTSMPLHARTPKSKPWESIRLVAMAREIAATYGFTMLAYGIRDHMYERVDQVEQTDFEFLACRCVLEGYVLKICDRKLILYDEAAFEASTSVRTIRAEQFDGDYEFRTVSTGLYGSCSIRGSSPQGTISSVFAPPSAPAGPILKPKIYAGSQGEADRYAKGVLRNENKRESTGRIQIELDSGIASGCCVSIAGTGMADGKYFVEQAMHRLAEGKTVLRLRRPLEGY